MCKGRLRVVSAITVVAIVVGSILFAGQILLYSHRKPPKLALAAGNTTYLWNGNFSSVNSSPLLGVLNSSAVINESKFPDSFLNMSLYGIAGYSPGSNSSNGMTLFQIYVLMKGTLAPNLLAKSIVLEQNGTVPTRYYGNQIWATVLQSGAYGFNFSKGSGKDPGYYSAPSPPNPIPNMSDLKMSYSWPLINVSASNHYPYEFSVAVVVMIGVYGVGPNDPFYMNFNASLEGLGQPVYAQTLITVNDLSGA